MAVCSHWNFSSNFGGFSRRFFIRTAIFLSESKTPPGVPVRALVIEKRVAKKPEKADCLFQRRKSST
jgi:hypothetical protein